ncbi:MAG: tail fiber domain-containing protein [Chitinophagales bacterium]|nr:tail fiber domain-containing protein [Chitinophagales bacterium]
MKKNIYTFIANGLSKEQFQRSMKANNFKYSLLILLALFFIYDNSYAQNVGINADGSSPNTSAGLDIKFTDKGLLIPRVKLDNLNSAAPITSPAEGLLVYNAIGTSPKGFYYWNGTKWIQLNTNAWTLQGNAGTIDGTHFLGTTDDQPLNFRVNNQKAGRIGSLNDKSLFIGYQTGNYYSPSDTNNIGIGYQALSLNFGGNNNIALGTQPLYYNGRGSKNIAIGYQVLYSNSGGHNNVAIGDIAMYSNYSGENNTAIGTNTLYSNIKGSNNAAIGNSALYYNTEGHNNAVVGSFALYNNKSGHNNTAIGLMALYSSVGDNNTAVGMSALSNTLSGTYNVATGVSALTSNTSGSYNTAMGYNALSTLSTGSNNIGIGYYAEVPYGTASNQVRIGNSAITYAGVQVAWTITSDRRWKENIQSSPLGLAFVNTLKPVAYTRKNDEHHRPEYGLIAQEVEEALINAGVSTEGIITKDDKGMYSLRYNDFIAPIVKSIQELSKENDELKANNKSLEERLRHLEQLMNTERNEK